MITPYVCERTDFKPGYFSCLDIETDAEKHAELIAGFLVWRTNGGKIRTLRFFTWDEFLSFITKHTSVKAFRKIYAHNGGGYDWLHLLTDWMKDKSKISEIKILRDGARKPICLSIKLPNKKGHIRLLDSFRLLPEKLAKLAITFQVGYKVTEGVDEREMGKLFRENPDLFWKRVETDTIYLHNIIDAFSGYVWNYVFHYDDLPLTIGSLALLYFRSTLQKPIHTVWAKEQKRFSRRSYTGGRVSTFFQGVTRAAAFDINSEYPAVMEKFTFPASNRTFWTKKLRDGGLYEIDYVQTNRMVPAYLRDEKTRDFEYTGHGVFWSWDIDNLIRLGGSISIVKGLVFQDWEPIFKEPIRKLYNLRLQFREQGNEAGSMVVKLLMNSMYGKFGQKPIGHETVSMTSEEAFRRAKEGERISFVSDGLFNVEKEIEIEHEFVAIASAVTSRGRELLYNDMLIAGNNLLQVDTDCVKVREEAIPLYEHRLDNKRLGFLKMEWKGEIAIVQNKLYSYRGDDGKTKVVSKGFPVSKLTHEMIKTIANKEVEKYEIYYEKPATLTEVMQGKQGGEFLLRHRKLSMSKPARPIGE